MKASPIFLCFLVSSASFAAESPALESLDSLSSDTRTAVDFQGFLSEASEALALRQSRLVDIDRFNAMAAEDGTVILDLSSKEARLPKRGARNP